MSSAPARRATGTSTPWCPSPAPSSPPATRSPSPPRRGSARGWPAGFRAFPAGIGSGKALERALAIPGTDPDDPWRFGAQLFAGVAAPAKVPDVVAVIGAWKPRLLIHDVTDFAGPVAAAHAGLPYAAHSLGPLFPLEFFRWGAELVAPLWPTWGVTPSPLGGMFAQTYLDICPPSFQSPDLAEVGDVAHPVRPVPFDAVAGDALPRWVDDLAPQPTVYVTLGTLDNHAPGVIEAVVEGLRDEPINVLVTVGPDRDPDDLGPQPPNVRVERYVAQSLLLPRCDAVVAHGGSGTTLAALAHGLPLVFLPQGANQFWNAARGAELGAGIRLLPDDVSPAAVRTAVHAVLEQPGYREAAERLAGEIAAMPGPETAVPLLESLAGAGR